MALNGGYHQKISENSPLSTSGMETSIVMMCGLHDITSGTFSEMSIGEVSFFPLIRPL